jgi:hypothetical protein
LSFGISGTPEVSSTVNVEITAQDIYLAEGTYGVMVKAAVNEVDFDEISAAGGVYTTDDNETYTLVDTFDPSITDYYILTYTANVDEDGYYPVKYTLGGEGEVTADDSTVANIAEQIAQAIDDDAEDTNDDSDAIAEYSITTETYDPNDADFDFDLDAETLTWVWEFGDTSYALGEDTVEADSNDARDTLLGDLMADESIVVSVADDNATLLTVGEDGIVTNSDDKEVGSLQTKFDIAILVEQVD